MSWSGRAQSSCAALRRAIFFVFVLVAAICAWAALAQRLHVIGPRSAVVAVATYLGHRPRRQAIHWAADRNLTADPECGPWRERYATLHADILAGRAPPRYLASVAVTTGASDRTVGTVSLLYWAVLSGRAIQLVTYDDLPDFGDAYDSPAIDWSAGWYVTEDYARRVPVPDPCCFPALLRYPPTIVASLRRVPPLIPNWLFPLYPGEPTAGPRPVDATLVGADAGRYHASFLHQGDEAMSRLFGSADLAAQSSASDTLLVATNRGKTHALFGNPHHGPTLRGWGLSPRAAFRCGFTLLFRPNAAVSARAARVLAGLPSGDVFLIALQIRTGDQAMRATGAAAATGDVLDRLAAPFLRCAERIGETSPRRRPGQPVAYVIVSDSAALRQRLVARYPGRVVAHLGDAVHTDCHNSGGWAHCGRGDMSTALQAIAADWELMAASHAHIISQRSGVGRIGAMLAPGAADPTVFILDDPSKQGFGDDGGAAAYASCSPEGAAPLDTILSGWSGL